MGFELIDCRSQDIMINQSASKIAWRCLLCIFWRALCFEEIRSIAHYDYYESKTTVD